jgi:hypothetical protein
LVLALGAPGVAVAQAPAAPAPGVSLSDDGTRVIYGPAFFAPFNAVTAVDILKRIPGIQDLLKFDNTFVPGGAFDAVEKRGFGSKGEQILVNGQRLSGKTNDTGTSLQRIQAKQVERVEVIRGAAVGLDVRSEGLVVNVVLRPSAGSGSWEGNVTHYSGGRVRWGGRVSYAGTVGSLSYTLGVEEKPNFVSRDRTELYVTPAGTPFQRQTENNEHLTDERIFTAGGSYIFSSGDQLTLNGRYSDKDEVEENPTYQFSLAAPMPVFLRLDDRERDTAQTTWELGGDYTHETSGGGQFKGLFVYTHGAFDRASPFKLTSAGGPEVLTRLQVEARTNSEKIVRGSYEWPLSAALNAETGAEVAINTLDKDVRMSVDQGGVLRPVRLFNAQSNIRETRLEPFAGLTWQATPKLFADLRMEAEYSKLNQSGPDVNNRRSLFYLRPGLDLRYAASPQGQVRASVQRTVSQLDFANFVATFETDDSRLGAVNAGNPDLVPEKAWEAALTYEHRLAGDSGTLSAKLFYDDITDRIANIAVGSQCDPRRPGPQCDTSAVGNVGAGRAYGVETKGSVRLAGLGLPGMVLNATLVARDSRYTDPLTGARFKFTDYPGLAYSAGFRHDIAWRDLSYGVTVEDEGIRRSADLNYTHRLNRRFDGTAFAEMRAFSGVKAKLEVRRILRGGAERDRLTYVGNRGFTPLLRTENRVAIFDRAIAFSLKGTF